MATQFSVASMGANSIQAGNDLKIGNVTSSKNDYKLISFFARAHYSYDERYMITATMGYFSRGLYAGYQLVERFEVACWLWCDW